MRSFRGEVSLGCVTLNGLSLYPALLGSQPELGCRWRNSGFPITVRFSHSPWPFGSPLSFPSLQMAPLQHTRPPQSPWGNWTRVRAWQDARHCGSAAWENCVSPGHRTLTLSRPRTACPCIFPASFNAHSVKLSLWPSYLHIGCNPSLF